MAWYICKVTFIPQLCVSVIGIFVCVVFAIKICNIRPGLVLADIGKYSLQLYLLDGVADSFGAGVGLHKSTCDCGREYFI